MEGLISVTQNKCKQCYSCVRNCPVNAVQITDGQAKIMYSRCINCGNCIKSCPQSAKLVIDSKSNTLRLLKEKVVACLAPSFVASFYPHDYKKVIGAIKELGFDEVWETAVGAEVLAKEVDKFIDKNSRKPYISTPCPAFVTMIEKHYPELIKYLLPFVSPMIVTARIIKKIDKNTRVIFIGPCVAKKAEANSPQFKNDIDEVLTFDEIKELLLEKNININRAQRSNFDSIYTTKGKLFPLSGGLLNNLKTQGRLKSSEYTFVDGALECINLIKAIEKGDAFVKFADVLMCKGCIEGPKIDSNLNYYEKRDSIYNFYNNRERNNKVLDIDINVKRIYKNRRSILALPSDKEINNILALTNKYSKEDELNCGACGYNTCRDKAIAVIQGIAEVDMCLPYLLSKKTKLLDELSKNFKEISMLKEELETIIHSSYDGLVITDGYGRILLNNNAWEKMTNYKKKKDDSVQNIQDKNVVFPSATILALKEKRRVSFIQYGNKNKKFLATATPILDNDGKITRVVSNIRDINELNKLKNQLEETRKLEKYHKEGNRESDNTVFDKGNLVVNSSAFGEVLKTASTVAAVDSTILILGESGVGKEVVAKFIKNLSNRKDKPFIKINCGAIPENLIESELFGYEAGAFTGARNRGKPGLIELAHRGILFLDEIGELPLNLQVKLLRVIQEKSITRIGGTKEKDIDIRIIAATNRNLYDMVKKGEFRVDLYYRLNVVPIEIPPLRKRKADIIPLSYHFINRFNKKYGCNKELTEDAEGTLVQYSWPGNVRELENIIERLVVTTEGDLIHKKDLPMFIFQNNNLDDDIRVDRIIPIKEAVENVEKKIIEKAYRKYSTTYEMANALGVNQSTVVRKIKKYIKNNALKHD